MRTLIFLISILMTSAVMSTVWADQPSRKPPVNNTVPPCDESATSNKPSCNIDSDSVNRPPKMPHERGVIVPPEVPAEGLPNQEQRRQQQPQQPVEPVPGQPATH